MNIWNPDTCSGLAEAAGGALRPGGLELTEHLIGFGTFAEGSRILDAGCGMGATARHLSTSRKLNIVGVDNSEFMLAAADRRTAGVELVCAALESLPFEGESFDGVLCECVLSQTDATATVAEFHRILRPGGRLLLTDLYFKGPARDPEAEPSAAGMPASRQRAEAVLEGAGFVIEHREDRTNDLRQLAVQLIMSGAKPAEILSWCGHTGCCSNADSDDWRRTVGYHLVVARKGTP